MSHQHTASGIVSAPCVGAAVSKVGAAANSTASNHQATHSYKSITLSCCTSKQPRMDSCLRPRRPSSLADKAAWLDLAIYMLEVSPDERSLESASQNLLFGCVLTDPR